MGAPHLLRFPFANRPLGYRHSATAEMHGTDLVRIVPDHSHSIVAGGLLDTS